MIENNERSKEKFSRLKTGFSNLELKLETSNQTTATLARAKEEEISSLTTELTTIKNLKDEEISSLKSQISSFSIRIDCNGMSKEGPGFLSQLKDKQKTPLDRLFVSSRSSSDIYCLIAPHTDDDFGTSNDGNSFIDFELEAAVTK
ncbi:hypothetical protein M9Y10_010095 [Tritrichomonas musculus]|uniref:Uncharacterized protein n=1 Tax=Tritrichomonas musculus TaxID=1915356 RepID=A0ABR2IR18_9EUKA